MTLLICLTCGHLMIEHEPSGCQGDIWPDDDSAPPDVCPCTVRALDAAAVALVAREE